MKYICNICSWEYDAEHGYGECAVKNDNKWEEIPEDFKRLLHGVSKEKVSSE